MEEIPKEPDSEKDDIERGLWFSHAKTEKKRKELQKIEAERLERMVPRKQIKPESSDKEGEDGASK